MATILAHITVKPGCAARFEQIATELYRQTHANETNVRHYEYWRGADENTYYTLLSFDTFDDFLVHQTSDHHETASPALGDVIAALRLEWVDPIASASPLTATVATTPPPGAPELARLYAERFAVDEQPWWMPLRASGATT
jgi:quinol monooxygenase YgiN